MQSVNCPACGAEVQFFSKLTVSLTCKYCNSLLVRDSSDIRNLGKISALLDDVTPLQLFSAGRAAEGSFQIIGRCRWAWEDGYWNEWFLHLSNGKPAWLAEAQGEYTLCMEDASVGSLPKPGKLKIDDTVVIGSQEYIVVDIKKAKLVAFEGELPFPPKIGDKKEIADLIADDAYGCIEDSEDGAIFVRGTVYDFEELKCTNLRRFEGW